MPNGKRQIYHYYAKWMVGVVYLSGVSACLRFGLKQKIATRFAGTIKELIGTSDLLRKER